MSGIKCEMRTALMSIGLQPEPQDYCLEDAKVVFKYGNWHMCERHAKVAFFAGLKSFPIKPSPEVVA